MTKPALNRHQRRRQRTQHQLEQATFELLIENGFEALTIQDIADRADLGRGTFYLHFQDKEQAVWSLTERVLREADSFSNLANANLASSVNLIHGFADFFEHAKQHHELFVVLLGSQSSPALTSHFHTWLTSQMQPLLQSAVSLLKTSSVPLLVMTEMITGAMARLLYWWLTTPEQSYSAHQMAAMLLEPFLLPQTG